MSWLTLTRLIVLGVSILFSFICLGLGAHILSAGSNSTVVDAFGDVFSTSVHYPFAALAVAVSVINLITVGPMLAIGLLRTGAFTSLVIVEISWLSLMWVLWLSVGAVAANATQFCGGSQFFSCTEGEAIAAFGFLTWLAFIGYSVTLLVTAILAHNRGLSVWMEHATEDLTLPPATTSEKPISMEATHMPVPVQTYAPVPPTSAGAYQTAPMSVQRVAAEV